MNDNTQREREKQSEDEMISYFNHVNPIFFFLEMCSFARQFQPLENLLFYFSALVPNKMFPVQMAENINRI